MASMRELGERAAVAARVLATASTAAKDASLVAAVTGAEPPERCADVVDELLDRPDEGAGHFGLRHMGHTVGPVLPSLISPVTSNP